MAPRAKYQIRVRLRGVKVHASGTADLKAARKRCEKEVKKAGIGAIGAVLEVVDAQSGRMLPVYEARLAYRGKKGTPTLVKEDHATPPPEHHTH